MDCSWLAYIFGRAHTKTVVVVWNEIMEAIFVNECTDLFVVCVVDEGFRGEVCVVDVLSL